MIPTFGVIDPDPNQPMQEGPIIYLLDHTQAKMFGVNHHSSPDKVFIVQIFETFGVPIQTINMTHYVSSPRITAFLTKKAEPPASRSQDDCLVYHVPHPGVIEGHVCMDMDALIVLKTMSEP